jgi:rfaE bifunctional protein nucleotidyltransferase chain/domain
MKVFYGKQPSKSAGVVWTNGCYDILHIGHARLFQYCRQIAEERDCSFFVGIDSDRRVSEMKGSDRPVNSENNRAEFLLSMKGVDRVYIYDTADELEELIRILNPVVMVIGEEYKDKSVVGSAHANDIRFFPKVCGYSTSKIIMKGYRENFKTQ